MRILPTAKPPYPPRDDGAGDGIKSVSWNHFKGCKIRLSFHQQFLHLDADFLKTALLTDIQECVSPLPRICRQPQRTFP